MMLRRLLLPAALLLSAVVATAFVPMARGWFGTAAGSHALGPHILEGGRIVLVATAWLSGAWLLARLLDEIFSRASRRGRKPQIPKLLTDLLRALLFTLALLGFVTSVSDASFTSLLATSSILIAVLGFALRNIIGDIFSGIALNIEHPYRLGDWIEVASGTVGQVVEINWRATRMVTNDGISVVVPNGLIAGGRLANFSQPKRSHRTAVSVCLPQEVPVERARRILLAAALCTDRILADPRPDVLIESINDRGVGYLIRFWLPDHGQDMPCRDAVLATVLAHLQWAGIQPARPQLRIDRRRPATDGAPAGFPAGPDSAPARGRRLLGRIGLFGAFEPDELDQLAAVMHRHHLPEGAVVVRQGDPGRSLFLIEEGALAVRAGLGEGRSVLLDRMGPGDLFGEMSLLTGQARSATVTTLTDAVVHEIDRDHIHPFLSRRPALAESLAGLMGERKRMNRALTEAEVTSLALPKSGDADLLTRLRAFFRLSA